ncbi:MAG: PDZ domain-containing protein [Chloroflexi bacterium]|nr:PDZ domain-containing protein [Chloroflexota bacterium]
MKRFAIVMTIGLFLLAGCGLPTFLSTTVANPTVIPALPTATADQAGAAPTAEAPAPASGSSSSSSPETLAAVQGTLENIYQQVSPSVVNISTIQVVTTSNAPDFSGIPNLPFDIPGLPTQPEQGQQTQESLGSGFVWDQEGHIITNNHVIDGADQISVEFADGFTTQATVVGADKDSDLAVLKVAELPDTLNPVKMGDSDQVRVGQLAIAIGNPFGLSGTMTTGIISAINRSLTVDSSQSLDAYYSIPDILQTDAPINPGNSGGVLVNDRGEVIGVTAAIESPVRASAGVGFAIPSNIVNRVVPVLIADGHYDHPWLGLKGTSLTPDLAQEMDLDNHQHGALVIEVTNNSPADAAGIRGGDKSVTINGTDFVIGGDVIVSFDGQTINEFNDLVAILASDTEIGKTYPMTVLRDGKEQELQITIAARPSGTNDESSSQEAAMNGQVWLGITGKSLTTDIAQAMELPEDQQGVLVEEIVKDSPADLGGVRGSYKPVEINGESILIGGDIIVRIDQDNVTDLNSLKDLLQQHQPGDQITIDVLRDGKTVSLDVTLAAPQG